MAKGFLTIVRSSEHRVCWHRRMARPRLTVLRPESFGGARFMVGARSNLATGTRSPSLLAWRLGLTHASIVDAGPLQGGNRGEVWFVLFGP